MKGMLIGTGLTPKMMLSPADSIRFKGRGVFLFVTLHESHLVSAGLTPKIVLSPAESVRFKGRGVLLVCPAVDDAPDEESEDPTLNIPPCMPSCMVFMTRVHTRIYTLYTLQDHVEEKTPIHFSKNPYLLLDPAR